MQDLVQRKSVVGRERAMPKTMAWLEPGARSQPLRRARPCGPTLRGGSGSGRHGSAAFGTPSTDVGAALHLRVVTHGLAVRRALAADLGTGAADDVVHAGAAQHRVGAGRANVGAGGHQADVFWCRVCASFGQAVVDGLQADRMALDTVVNAIVHRLRPISSGMVSHVMLLLPSGHKIGVPASPPPIARICQCCANGSVVPSRLTISTV